MIKNVKNFEKGQAEIIAILLVTCGILMFIFIALMGEVTRMRTCVGAQLSGIALQWEIKERNILVDTYTCHIPIELNGEEIYLSPSEYNTISPKE